MSMKTWYLACAVVAVALAVTSPFWIPYEWAKRPITKQQTQAAGNFPSFDSSSNKNDDELTSVPFSPSSVRVFSKEELSHYDGVKDPAKPLYLVVLGEIFDVTSGERFYAPGNGYSCFVAKDNSAAFHTGEFKSVQEDVTGLPATAVAAVLGWRSFFRKHETYKFVGVVEGLYFDKSGEPTSALAAVHKLGSRAKSGEAEDARRAKLFPRCNMHYDGLAKITTVWCDGYKEESDLAKMKADTELRVLRMVHFTSQATGERTKDCRCLRLQPPPRAAGDAEQGTTAVAEADVGSSPFPTAEVDYYYRAKGCDPNLPRCRMDVS